MKFRHLVSLWLFILISSLLNHLPRLLLLVRTRFIDSSIEVDSFINVKLVSLTEENCMFEKKLVANGNSITVRMYRNHVVFRSFICLLYSCPYPEADGRLRKFIIQKTQKNGMHSIHGIQL